MTTLKELHLNAARVAGLIEGTDITMGECWKYAGKTFRNSVTFVGIPNQYEACLAIVEGKPVFKGDKLWSKLNGTPHHMHEFNYDWENYSWNPPQPRTIMVELLVEDVEHCAKHSSYFTSITEACRKALDNMK